MPALVAAFTDSSNVSYFGLKATVQAQSMIRPAQTPNTNVSYCLHIALCTTMYPPLIWVPKSTFITSSYPSTVLSPVLGV